MKSVAILLPFLSIATAFSPPSCTTATNYPRVVPTLTKREFQVSLLSAKKPVKVADEEATSSDVAVATVEVTDNGSGVAVTNDASASGESGEGVWIDESKKVELIALGIWMIAICGFILTNNFYGPWPLAMKQVPERVFFLSHMIGGMLFGGGIILTTCIERLVAKSNNAPVLQFWFDKVPVLDGLIVVPALTVSMVSGTGLSIVRYGGLNIAPPHVGAIFWTLIAFMTWWATTDLTTQGTALAAVNEMYKSHEEGEAAETPKVVVDRHLSNVVSCFFVVLLYSMMVMKPGTLFPFPWSSWT